MKKIEQIENKSNQVGFTIMELMITLAIIGILSAIAYPNYQKSVKKTKRVDMMTSMVGIASSIESSKLAKGKYKSVDVSPYKRKYPNITNALYDVDITPSTPNLEANWEIKATPISDTLVSDDGVLTLNFQNEKCRDTKCGYAKEWNESD